MRRGFAFTGRSHILACLGQHGADLVEAGKRRLFVRNVHAPHPAERHVDLVHRNAELRFQRKHVLGEPPHDQSLVGHPGLLGLGREMVERAKDVAKSGDCGGRIGHGSLP